MKDALHETRKTTPKKSKELSLSDALLSFPVAVRSLYNTIDCLAQDVENNKEKLFLDYLGKIVLFGAKDPCIMNQEELFDMKMYRPREKESIYKMNDEFNNAENLEDIEKCIEKAKKEGINVRDEFVSIFYFVKDLKNVKDSFQSVGKKAQPLFAAIIQAMSSLYNLAIVEYSLEHQEIISKNFKEHNKKRENEYMLKICDFQMFLMEIEDKWHPREGKHYLSCKRACEIILKKYEKNEILKNLFLHYDGIDSSDPKNRQKCVNILAELTSDYRLRFLSKHSDYAHKPQKRKGRSVESRNNSSEGQKRTIERKKNESMKGSE